MPRSLRAARDGERGAVLVVCALVLTALIAFTSLAVDLGFQRMARRDMQALADVVALDLVRRIDGSTATALTPTMDTALAESVARNTGTLGEAPDVTYRLGTVNTSNLFVPVAAGTDVPTAVEVIAGTSVDYWFRPGTGDVARRAVASTIPEACFSLGSFAVGLSSQQSTLLNSLIGDALNLGVAGYDGLATSSISLFGLATELGFGTVDQLLDADVTLAELYLAAANVLEREGDTLNFNFVRTIGGSVPALPPITLGELISAAPSSEAALGTDINILDLVAGTAFLANGTNLLTVPGLSINVGSVINLTTTVEIIERQRRACGRVGARAETSQISLDVGGNGVNLALPIVGVGNVTVGLGGIQVELDTAGATGTLTRILCGSVGGTPTVANPNGIDVGVLTSLLQAGISVPLTVTGRVSLLGLVGLVDVSISVILTAGTNQPEASSTAQFRMPPDTFGTTKETGTGTVGLSGLALTRNNLTVTATLLPILGGGIPISLNANQLNQILNPVISGVVNPLITNLDALLLGPLTDLFGLNVAGADVTWEGPLECDGPALVA